LRKDYTVGLKIAESGLDDPDAQFYENYACSAPRNYTDYCNPEIDKLVDRQSAETDMGKRKQVVWEIEKKLAADDARPVLFYPRGAVCRTPELKGLTLMVSSIYNGQRFEDL
jgi:peptide/nickel transport system substrate-binding protein